MSECTQNARAVRPIRTRHVQRLAQYALGIHVVSGLRKGLAQLSAKDEHRSHRVIELSAKQLATREVEAAPQGKDGPGNVAARRAA